MSQLSCELQRYVTKYDPNKIGSIVAAESTPKLLNKRRKKNKLSPCCAKLYLEYAKSRKQEFSKRARRAMKFSKALFFEKFTKNMNPITKRFLWMQIQQCTHQTKGSRFSDKEKLIALSIMKQSPKYYRFLHKLFVLPSKNTLNRMISELNVEDGVNTQIIEAVKKEAVTWDENKKYCSILFGEVPLQAAVTYDKHTDAVNGFVELPHRTIDFADHALVFMLRGAICKWEQPFAVYFSKGATSGVQLKTIITDIVTAVGNTGLLPVALISDQGKAFQSALKGLLEVTRREQILAGDKIDDVIVINGHTLSIIFDPPHLMKGLRNNFLTKDIKYDNKISKWSDIVDVYRKDYAHTQARLLHKLNPEDVIPQKIKKNKVKNCVKVFSKKVAATLSYTSLFSRFNNGNPVSETTKNTAGIVSFFDDLFDSVNGTSISQKKKEEKPLRHAVTENSINHTFWKEAVKKVEKIKFIDDRGKETTVPTLKNWIVTLKSLQRLWQYFQTKGIDIMRPRYFNSSPIEMFLGQVRAYNLRNNNPNCHAFKSTFRSLLYTRLRKFQNLTEDLRNECLPESTDFLNSVQLNIETATASQERLNIHLHACTTGWIIKKVLKRINCKKCEACLTSDEGYIEKNSTNNFISFREIESIKASKLTYPSEHAIRFFGDINIFAYRFLESNPQRKNIVKFMRNELKSKYSCELVNCEQHKDILVNHFLNIALQLTVINWCNTINNILMGTDIITLKNKSLPPIQQKAYEYFKTELRNKNVNK